MKKSGDFLSTYKNISKIEFQRFLQINMDEVCGISNEQIMKNLGPPVCILESIVGTVPSFWKSGVCVHLFIEIMFFNRLKQQINVLFYLV